MRSGAESFVIDKLRGDITTKVQSSRFAVGLARRFHERERKSSNQNLRGQT